MRRLNNGMFFVKNAWYKLFEKTQHKYIINMNKKLSINLFTIPERLSAKKLNNEITIKPIIATSLGVRTRILVWSNIANNGNE